MSVLRRDQFRRPSATAARPRTQPRAGLAVSARRCCVVNLLMGLFTPSLLPVLSSESRDSRVSVP